MNDICDDIVTQNATGTIGRWTILAIVLALLLLYATEKQEHTESDWLSYQPDTNLSLSFGERTMFESNNWAEVSILPGFHEPANLKSRVQMAAILDFSGSMARHAGKLPIVWSDMVTALAKQPIQRLRIELACCAFDDHVMFQDYAPLPFYQEQSLEFAGGGMTSLGQAILTTIDRTRRRREQLAAEGIQCNRAVCPVLSDGYATDRETLESAIPEMRRAEERREIEFVPLAPDLDCVSQLKAVFGKDPIPLYEVNFDILFRAIGGSMSRYSQSRPGLEPNAMDLIRKELGHSPNRPRLADRTERPRLPYQGN